MPQPSPAGLNTSASSGLSYQDVSALPVSGAPSTSSGPASIDIRRVAELVRQLAEARLEIQQLKAALETKRRADQESAAEKERENGEAASQRNDLRSSQVRVTTPEAREAAATGAVTAIEKKKSSAPPRANSPDTSSAPSSPSSLPSASSADEKPQPSRSSRRRDATHHARQHSPTSVHSSHPRERNRRNADHSTRHRSRSRSRSRGSREKRQSRRRQRDYRDRYHRLRLQYDALQLRREQELGEIQHLVHLLGLEQEQGRLRHEQRRLLRAMGISAKDGTAPAIAAPSPPPQQHKGVDVQRDAAPSRNACQGDSLHSRTPVAAADPLPQQACDAPGQRSTVSDSPRQLDTPQAAAPESLDVTRLSQMVLAAEASPVEAPLAAHPTQIRAPPDPSMQAGARSAEPVATTAAAAAPWAVSAPFAEESVPRATVVHQLQQEVALWKDECLRLLLAAQGATAAAAPPPLSPQEQAQPPTSSRADKREEEEPHVGDISVDPLPPPPVHAHHTSHARADARGTTAKVRAVSSRPGNGLSAPEAPSPHPGLFLGVPPIPAAAMNGGDSSPLHRTGPDGSTTGFDSVYHVPDPVSRWRTSGNALPPHMYQTTFPLFDGSSAESILQAYAHHARGVRERTGHARPSSHTATTESRPAVTTSARSARSSRSSASPAAALATPHQEAVRSRAQLERDIARHDQLLTAIAQLQRTAAEKAARKPASMGASAS